MTDQTRADFEAHFGLTTRQAWTHPDGSYKFPEIQAKWEGWQAGVTMAAKAASATALTPAAWICIYDDGEVDYTPLRELAEAAPTAIPLYRAPPVEQDPNMWLNVPEDGGPITSYYAAPVAAAAPGAVPDDAKDAAIYDRDTRIEQLESALAGYEAQTEALTEAVSKLARHIQTSVAPVAAESQKPPGGGS